MCAFRTYLYNVSSVNLFVSYIVRTVGKASRATCFTMLVLTGLVRNNTSTLPNKHYLFDLCPWNWLLLHNSKKRLIYFLFSDSLYILYNCLFLKKKIIIQSLYGRYHEWYLIAYIWSCASLPPSSATSSSYSSAANLSHSDICYRDNKNYEGEFYVIVCLT